MYRKQLMILLAAAVLVAVSAVIFWRALPGALRKKPAIIVKKKTPKKLSVAPAVVLPAVEKRIKRPSVVIVMDDFGNNAAGLDAVFDIGEPITLSVLPGLPFSKQTAGAARTRGYEVILHLPLEAKSGAIKQEAGTITSGMADGEIASLMKNGILSVPGAVGVSNHMGSKATADRKVMDTVMSFLKKNRLFFFDSMTAPDSVCAAAAAAAGVRYARRDVFLDVEDDSEYIEKQALKLRKIAFTKGTATAVCHYRQVTIKTLARMMPAMAADGIEFVKLSELVK